ncbi:MAG: hypothetical protein IT260_04170 [Saprospiraceae bacterium]|nr:hypothetical protein [Saprospiraceae bacterium]
MKTLVVVLLCLAGTVVLLRQNQVFADPTGAIGHTQMPAIQVDTVPQSGMFADPSGTVAIKMASRAKLAQQE